MTGAQAEDLQRQLNTQLLEAAEQAEQHKAKLSKLKAKKAAQAEEAKQALQGAKLLEEVLAVLKFMSHLLPRWLSSAMDAFTLLPLTQCCSCWLQEHLDELTRELSTVRQEVISLKQELAQLKVLFTLCCDHLLISYLTCGPLHSAYILNFR